MDYGVLTDVVLLFLLEIMEGSLIKGRNFPEVVNYFYFIFRYRPWQFFLMHSSLLYLVFYGNWSGVWNGWMIFAVGMKCLDLGLKLWLFRKIHQSGALSLGDFGGVDVPLSPWLRYSGAFIYPPLLLAALN